MALPEFRMNCREGTMTLSRRPLRALPAALGALALLALGWTALLRQEAPRPAAGLLLAAVSLAALPRLERVLRAGLRPRRIVLDRFADRLEAPGGRRHSLAELEHVRLRRLALPGGGRTHSLWAVLRDGTRLRLAGVREAEVARQVATQVSGYAGVGLVEEGA